MCQHWTAENQRRIFTIQVQNINKSQAIAGKRGVLQTRLISKTAQAKEKAFDRKDHGRETSTCESWPATLNNTCICSQTTPVSLWHLSCTESSRVAYTEFPRPRGICPEAPALWHQSWDCRRKPRPWTVGNCPFLSLATLFIPTLYILL